MKRHGSTLIRGCTQSRHVVHKGRAAFAVGKLPDRGAMACTKDGGRERSAHGMLVAPQEPPALPYLDIRQGHSSWACLIQNCKVINRFCWKPSVLS